MPYRDRRRGAQSRLRARRRPRSDPLERWSKGRVTAIPRTRCCLILGRARRWRGNNCILDAKHTERHQGVGAKVKAGAYFVQWGDCSQTIISAPRRSSASAAARPPTPPPTMAMRGVRVIRATYYATLTRAASRRRFPRNVISLLKFRQAWERLVIFASRPYRQTERHHVGNGPQARWTAGRASIASCQRFRLG
jgi:hypothetical protein